MGHPRFNHVALSVAESMLDDAGRAELVDFYADVFGWSEMPTMTKPGRQLVLQAWSYDQFVFIVSEDHPMQAAAMDHFGMATETLEEFERFYTATGRRAQADDRVELTEVLVEDFDVLTLHNYYLRFLLPLRIEVQYWDWAEGLDPRAQS